jgi:ParB-like nuclease domain
MSHIQSIPLSKLAPSPLNARRIEKKVAVEELSASIQAHGLLQSLTVVCCGSKTTHQNRRLGTLFIEVVRC